MRPSSEQAKRCLEHVAHEYVSCLAAAKEMTRHDGEHPIDFLLQDAFLTHFRTLAEFLSRADEGKRDTLIALHFVDKVAWDVTAFLNSSGLVTVINKHLSHLTLFRDSEAEHSVPIGWSGRKHLVGAVRLLLEAWDKFVGSLNQELGEQYARHLREVATKYGLNIDEFKQHYVEWAQSHQFNTADLPEPLLNQY